MSFDVKSEATRIIRTANLRHVALLIGALALVAWAFNSVLQTSRTNDVIRKNEKLVEIVEDLEAQNEELDNRLQCRAALRDDLDRAIGRGLAAVAQDDPAELQRQAEVIVALTQEDTDC